MSSDTPDINSSSPNAGDNDDGLVADLRDLACLAALVSGAPIAVVECDWTAGERRHGLHGIVADDPFVDDLLRNAEGRSAAIITGDGASNGVPSHEPGTGCAHHAPVIDGDGAIVGTVHVADRVPREWRPDTIAAVAIVARQCAAIIRARRDEGLRAAAALEEAEKAARRDAFVRRIVDGTTNGMVSVNPAGRFVYVNQRMCEITGYSESELLAATFTLLLTPQNFETSTDLFERMVTRAEDVRSMEVEIVRRDGAIANICFTASAIEHRGTILGIAATVEDVTERKRAEQLVAEQSRLLEMIAVRSDAGGILTEIALTVERQSGMQCSILLLDSEAQTLHVAAAPSVPAALSAAANGLRIGPAAGSCGTAAFRRSPVISRDVQIDPLWADFRDVMATHGLRSSWSTPFFDEGGAVVGTVALYGTEVGGPSVWDTQVIDLATHLAATVVQRDRTRALVVESEARYRDLFENANDILYTHDLQGRFLSVNAAGVHAYGLSDDDLGGLNIADIVDPAWLQTAIDSIRSKATGDQRSDPYEILTHRRDGSDVWVEVNTRLVRPSGKAPFIQGIARDITERKLAEDALRRSETRYRVLAENIFDTVSDSDARGRIAFVTDNIEKVLGYTAEEFTAGLPLDTIHPDDVMAVQSAYARAVAGARSEQLQYRLRHKDGTWRRMESSATCYRDDDGGVRVVAVSRDVTPRVEMEQLLRVSETRLRTFVRNAPMILFALDRDGVFTLHEGRGLERVGLQPEQHVGSSVFDAFAGQPHFLENVRRGLAGEAFVDTLPIGQVTLEAHHTPVIGDDGAIDGLIVMLIDITARQRAEELVSAQRQLLEMTAIGAPLERVLEAICHRVESQAPGVSSSIMLASSDGRTLTRAAGGRLPAALQSALDGLPIDRDGPGPAAAVAQGELIVAADLTQDAAWAPLMSRIAGSGVRACWSTPIRATTGSVLGALSVFLTKPRGPREHDLDVIAMATHIAGIAIERERVEKAVRARSAELETMYKRLVRAHSDLEESKTQLEEQSAQLERALAVERDRARTDPLTGLLNHAAITDTLRELTSVDPPASVAIAMVDVDGLKAANDTYGHQIGDAVLVMVAEKLSRRNAIVGRYGGDEFVAILPGASRADAEAYRRDVLSSLTDAGLIDPETGATVPVVASVGVAVYPEEAAAADDLIRLSDSAMYASRRERPADAAGRVLSRTLGGDRAAKMVGEIVPLLTSAGSTEEKLRMVAHRLSVGAGYDGVHFVINDERSNAPASSSFARVPEQDIEEFDENQANNIDRGIARILNKTRRPIVIDDFATTDLLEPNLRAGLIAAGLRSCLIAPMLWENTLIGAMSVASKRHAGFSVRDAEFVLAVATQVTAIVQMSRVVEQLTSSSAHLRAAHESTVLMLASAAEAHDRTTGRHLERVRLISEALAGELGYDEAATRELGMAAILHDIGKIRVPDTVLGSSQSLADAEWVLMKQHTVWGSAFLSGQPGFELAAMVARCHHERWDGAGYPDGLVAQDIPEAAQITTVADSFDAMTNDRPYRNGRPIADAVAEIVSCAGTQFSPRVVDALVRLFEQDALDFLHAEDDLEQRAA